VRVYACESHCPTHTSTLGTGSYLLTFRVLRMVAARNAGFFSEEIVAEDDDSVRDVFLSKKRLCKRCLPAEEVNLQFDRERLSELSWGP
jgi:hypothetical protein